VRGICLSIVGTFSSQRDGKTGHILPIAAETAAPPAPGGRAGNSGAAPRAA
jgi:hypothetical protein